MVTERSPIATEVIKKASQLISERYKDFSIFNLQFSIVYQPYHSNTLNIFLEHGNVVIEPFPLEKSLLSGYQASIKKVVATGAVDSCPTGKYLIVPMRLDPKAKAQDGNELPPRRVVGAFLLESDTNNAFQVEDENLKVLFDHFSDRVAVLIQLGEYKTRPQLTGKLHSEYLGNIGNFKSELQIFEKLIDSLTKNELDYHYSVDEITILLYHPFYINQLYFVCEDGKLNSNFRKSHNYQINSTKVFNLLGENTAAIFSKQDNKVIQFKLGNYCSNIVVPVLVHNHNKIGYLVLRTQQANVYRNEENILKRTADILAATLRSFRHDTWELEFSEFFKKYIDNNKSYEDKDLYQAVVNVLERIYGTIEFAVVSLSQEDRTAEFNFKHGSDWDEAKLLLEELSSYINKINLKPFHSKSKEYYIYNISAESGRITNFIIIKMTRESATATHSFIQRLLAMVGTKQSFMRKKRRLKALTEFCTAITNKKNITLGEAFDLAYNHTRKVMTAPNMYIALLDKKIQEITFPLFKIKNDETGEIEDFSVEPRIFDRTAKSKPRTEYILANPINKNNEDKEPEILKIDTKDESIQWYKDNGNSEQLGNPFASWIGVPIMNAGEAIGVIAVYHPTAEYLYNKEGDGVFLKNIAAHFSSLLVRVDMEKSVHREQLLRDAAKQEEEWVKAFIFKQLKEKTSDIIFDLEQTTALTIKDIEIYRKRENISDFFEDAFIMQNEASHFIAEIKKNIESMSMSSKKENIDFSYLIRSILDSLDAFTYIVETNKSKERRIDIFAKYDDYFIVLFSLLKSVIGFVKDRKIQIKYEIIKGSKSISINFIFNNNDIQGDWLDNVISVPNIVGERRLKAKINFENHTLIWQSPLEHQETVLIVGGALATKRTLESTLSSLEIKSQYADKIFESELLRIIFLLDSEKKDINYQGKAKVISVEAIKDFDDINFPYFKIEKTKLSNKNYIDDLLKAVGYYD